MSGLSGVFSFDRERRFDARSLFRAARRAPHVDQRSEELAGVSWCVESGPAPAALASDVEQRVRAIVLGRFSSRLELIEELTRAGLEVGPTDADLAVAAYRAWGSDFASHLTGQFAVALFDADAHALLLTRDARGTWPLYHRVSTSEVAFSTRLQPLLEARIVPRVLDPEGAASYFRLGFVPSPRSPVRDVEALPPGVTLVATRERRAVVRHHRADFSVQDEATSLDEQLGRAEAILEAELRADPEPREVWLQPDLPSVVLTAMRGRALGRTVETASPDGDERSARFAHLLGTRHRVVPVEPGLDDVVRLVGALDLPFADPAWLVRDAVGRSRDVAALSCAGAEPVFATNPRYPDALTADAVRRSVPDWLGALAPSFDRSVEAVIRCRGWPTRLRGLNEDFSRAVQSLRGPDLEADADPLSALQSVDLRYGVADAQLVALAGWTPWSGVEVATPYLAPALLDVATRFPARGRLEGREVGAGLARIARRMLPGRLTREDFGMWTPPVGTWMRGGLREAAEMAFFGTPGGLSGLLDDRRLRSLWYAHQVGWADHGVWLFALMVFELWVQSMLGERSSSFTAM